MLQLGEAVLFKLLPTIHVFIGINSLSEQQSKLFIRMTNSEIIEDQANCQLLMTCTLALLTHSMSDIVLIDVGKFHFTSTPFTHHPIHSNQIPREQVSATCHEPNAVNELQLSLNLFYLTQRGLVFIYSNTDIEADVLLQVFSIHADGASIELFPNIRMNRCTS